MDWTSGYVADIDYTYGYYAELNPLRARLALLNSGFPSPAFTHACELGFGQGVSINVHAAGSSINWYGTDFNPAQAGFAQELARVSAARTKLFDDAFADFVNRPDIPDLDFVGVHGIWSWINDTNRAHIVDFLRRKLKVGGVLYVSYNTLPGWGAFAPMRHLLTQHAEVMGASGQGVVSRVEGAIEFANQLLATNPAFARANPSVAERVKSLAGHNRNYLAHEYFNRDWHPMHVATMAEWLAPAKLSLACSAHYLDHIDNINLTQEQQALLNRIPDNVFRQTARDFMINQQFRRDYWVKGGRRLSGLEQLEALRTQRLLLASYRPDVAMKVSGAVGEATLHENVYQPLLDLLADHHVRSIGEIESSLSRNKLNLAQILQALLVLIGQNHVQLANEKSDAARAREQTERLNNHLLQKSRASADIAYLASPVSGGGISVGRISQLFILGRNQGQKQASELAESAWKWLAAQNQRLLKDGKPLETADENLGELRRLAELFQTREVPILRALQIV